MAQIYNEQRVLGVASIAIDNRGVAFDLESAAKHYEYDGSGNLDYVTATASDGITRKRDYTYNASGNITDITGWVQQ